MATTDTFSSHVQRSFRQLRSHGSIIATTAVLFALPQAAMTVLGDFLGITSGRPGVVSPSLLAIFFVLAILALLFSVATQVFYTLLAMRPRTDDVFAVLKDTAPYLISFVLLPIRIFFWSYGWLLILGLFLIVVADALQADWPLFVLAWSAVVSSLVLMVLYSMRYAFSFLIVVRDRTTLGEAMRRSSAVAERHTGALLKNFFGCALLTWGVQLIVILPLSIATGAAAAMQVLPKFTAEAILNLLATSLANASIAFVVFFSWQLYVALGGKRPA